MAARFRYILEGIGSILDIAPDTDYGKFVPKKTPQERMAERWQRVGRHINVAIQKVVNEQKKEKEG